MNNIVFSHIMQRHQKLYRKPSNQSHRHTLEVVTLDELIEIHTEHLKDQNKMLSKNKLFNNFDNVLLVFRIVRAQSFENFSFDKALFI